MLFWTLVVLCLPLLWYVTFPPAGGWLGGPLYYSVVTFVTSPPRPPPTGGTIHLVTQAIVLAQTYLGTSLIILLGYVLGNRDRI